jgi:hypothetical protein
VVWSSHDTSIATIDADGTIHTKAKGTAEILATYKSVSGKTPLQVTAAVLQSVRIDSKHLASGQISRATGLVEQVSLVGSFSDGHEPALAADQIHWMIADTSVAALKSGNEVQFLKEGTTTLKGELQNFTDTVQLTTTAAIPVSIEIGGAPSTMPAGTAADLTAKVVYSDSSTVDVTADAAWSSSNPSVAIVADGGSKGGHLHASAQGSTTITANDTQDGVAVNGETAISVTPSSLIGEVYDASDKSYGRCGAVGSEGSSYSFCRVSGKQTLIQNPPPAWFTFEQYKLTAKGRDWKVDDIFIDGTNASTRIAGLKSGDTIKVGSSVKLELQTQSTGGSASSIHMYIHVIDNDGSKQPIVNIAGYTVTTN